MPDRQYDDTYITIAAPAEAIFKDRNSRFLAFAYPINSVDEATGILESLRKKYYDATHHCYAYRLGADGATFRANDDGEPSGTAGRPILGQMLSNNITNCLIVVVRYFGGTKLGVPGLINAYRESAATVIDAAETVERTVDILFETVFPYVCMNNAMKVIKEEHPRIISQNFDNLCTITLSIRTGRADAFEEKFRKIEGANIEKKG